MTTKWSAPHVKNALSMGFLFRSRAIGMTACDFASIREQQALSLLFSCFICCLALFTRVPVHFDICEQVGGGGQVLRVVQLMIRAEHVARPGKHR